MKQVLIIVTAMVVGAISFWAIAPYFTETPTLEETDPTLNARLEAQRKVDEARQKSIPKEAEETKPEVKESEQSSTVEESFGIKNHGPFPIVGTRGDDVSGAVEIIESPEEQLVYFKDYEGTAGPDLKVYLSTDLEASEFFDLGDAKGTEGNLIYGVPLSVDFSDYTYVLTWSESLGVVFDHAQIK